MEVLPLRWEATLVVFLEIGAGARSNRVGLGLVIGTLGFGFSYNFFFYFTALVSRRNCWNWARLVRWEFKSLLSRF